MMTHEEIRKVDAEIQTKLNLALFLLKLYRDASLFNNQMNRADDLYDLVYPLIQESYELSEHTLSEFGRMVSK